MKKLGKEAMVAAYKVLGLVSGLGLGVRVRVGVRVGVWIRVRARAKP